MKRAGNAGSCPAPSPSLLVAYGPLTSALRYDSVVTNGHVTTARPSLPRPAAERNEKPVVSDWYISKDNDAPLRVDQATSSSNAAFSDVRITSTVGSSWVLGRQAVPEEELATLGSCKITGSQVVQSYNTRGSRWGKRSEAQS